MQIPNSFLGLNEEFEAADELNDGVVKALELNDDGVVKALEFSDEFEAGVENDGVDDCGCPGVDLDEGRVDDLRVAGVELSLIHI